MLKEIIATIAIIFSLGLLVILPFWGPPIIIVAGAVIGLAEDRARAARDDAACAPELEMLLSKRKEKLMMIERDK